MKIFGIGDLHLSFDENVDKPMDTFGDLWNNYEKRLKEKWESLVCEEDVVIIPGDISWGIKLSEAIPDLEFISNLSGKKILLRGNHDLWWSRIKYLNTLYENMFFLQNNCYFIEKANIAIAGTRGWVLPSSPDFSTHDEKIFNREIIRLELSLKEAKKKNPSKIICATHYPPMEENLLKNGLTDLMKEYRVSKCIYGHLHGENAFRKGVKGKVDDIEYNLVSLDYLGVTPKLILEI